MIKFFKKLKWLIKNQDKIEKLLDNKTETKEDLRYSLAGVPKYQLKDIDDILHNDEVK